MLEIVIKKKVIKMTPGRCDRITDFCSTLQELFDIVVNW